MHVKQPEIIKPSHTCKQKSFIIWNYIMFTMHMVLLYCINCNINLRFRLKTVRHQHPLFLWPRSFLSGIHYSALSVKTFDHIYVICFLLVLRDPYFYIMHLLIMAANSLYHSTICLQLYAPFKNAYFYIKISVFPETDKRMLLL